MTAGPATLVESFLYAARTWPKPDALRYKDGGVWKDISTQEFLDLVRKAACGLMDLGIQPGDRVALLSENRPEWIITDIAILCTGGVTVPIYPTLLEKDVQYILRDSDARVLLASKPEHLDKATRGRADLPSLAHLVLYPPCAGRADAMTWSDLLERGRKRSEVNPREFDERCAGVKPEQLATLPYTSGTTGTPKGVMLTHENIMSNLRATCAEVGVANTEVALSFLPLSHILERMFEHALISRGCTIAYAESIDTVAANMAEVKPTVMAGVPRFFEKLRMRVLETISQASPIRQKLFHWGVGVGKKVAALEQAGRPVGFWLGVKYGFAKRKIFSKVAAATGGRLKYFLSGGAPLAKEVAEFFYAVGLPVYEGYGLTETSPVLSLNTPKFHKLGTVGKVIPGVTIKIAEDGEILAKGPNVMQGYYHLPEETAEVLKDGWFHTGDIGVLDDEGYLRITDRKKDLLKTSGGKYVAPQPIENALKLFPYVSSAMVMGNARKYCSALIVPDFEKLERFAKERNLPTTPRSALCQHPEVRRLFDGAVEELNRGLAQFETIKKYALLESDFEIGDEMTPTLKVKRKVVEKKYSTVIDSLYAEDGR